MKCKICKATAVVALRSHNAAFCPDCYLKFFARQVEKGIEGQKLFTRDERILVALSGWSFPGRAMTSPACTSTWASRNPRPWPVV